VGFVGECSVQKYEDQIRLIFQLLDGTTGGQVWADDYDRDLTVGNLFSIQRDIAQQIAHAVGAVLTGEEQVRIEATPTTSLDSYELYLLGRLRFFARTAEDLRHAIQYFEAAIDQDPTFALAWAGLADAWTVLPWYEPVPSRDAYARGMDAAQRALDLDDDLAEGHAALGGLALYHAWDWERAEAHLSRAVVLNPNHAQAHLWLAYVHSFQRRQDQALHSILEGLRLNPLGNNFHATLAGILYDAGRVEEALEAYRESERLEPQARIVLLMMSLILTQEGRADEAFPVIQRWARVVGYPQPERLPLVLRAFEDAELTEEAVAVLEDVRRTTGLEAGFLAGLYVNLDAPAEALSIVQEAIAQRQVFVPFLAMAPLRDEVLENPEIVAALQAAGIAVQ
jgi:tetratricopeptide (TPR) repeat protein